MEGIFRNLEGAGYQAVGGVVRHRIVGLMGIGRVGAVRWKGFCLQGMRMIWMTDGRIGGFIVQGGMSLYDYEQRRQRGPQGDVRMEILDFGRNRDAFL